MNRNINKYAMALKRFLKIEKHLYSKLSVRFLHPISLTFDHNVVMRKHHRCKLLSLLGDRYTVRRSVSPMSVGDQTQFHDSKVSVVHLSSIPINTDLICYNKHFVNFPHPWRIYYCSFLFLFSAAEHFILMHFTIFTRLLRKFHL